MIYSKDEISFTQRCRGLLDDEVKKLIALDNADIDNYRVIARILAREGLLASHIGTAWSGSGRSFSFLSILHEEVGRYSSGLLSLLTVHSMVARAIERFGSDELRSLWLPRLAKGEVLAAFAASEPQAGSDLKAISTTAEYTPQGWVINGTKTWISFGGIADLFLVFAQSSKGSVALLVDKSTSGVRVEPLEGLEAPHGAHLSRLTFNNCIVPEHCLVGRRGFGLRLVAFDALNVGRLAISAGCAGIIQQSLRLSTDFASTRTQFGEPIIKHQLVASKLSSMVVSLTATRQLVRQASLLLDASSPEAPVAACVAKLFSAKAAFAAAADAVQIHGARGCLSGTDVFRLLQDAKVAEIIEGSNEIQEIIISAAASQTDPFFDGR